MRPAMGAPLIHMLMLWSLLILPLMPTVVGAASQQGAFTICHSTGLPTNPWVLITVDERAWPEHEAEGDFRASSLAECAAHPQPALPAAGTQPGGTGPGATVLPSGGEPDRQLMVLGLLGIGAIGLCLRRLGRRPS